MTPYVFKSNFNLLVVQLAKDFSAAKEYWLKSELSKLLPEESNLEEMVRSLVNNNQLELQVVEKQSDGLSTYHLYLNGKPVGQPLSVTFKITK